jgi:L-malate glycosyltransferase
MRLVPARYGEHMRICYFGVADAHVKKLSTYFLSRGHEVHLVTWTYQGSDKQILGDVRGLRIHYLGGNNQRLNKWCLPLAYLKLRRLLKESKPDVLHTLYLLPYSLHGVILGFHPHMAAAWGSDVLIAPRRSRILRCAVKFILKRADSIASVAPHVTEALLELGADKKRIFAAPLGVDTTQFNPEVDGRKILKQLGWQNNPIVISTRSLEPVYNLKMLLDAVPTVLKEKPDARFIIAGSGTLETQLKQHAKTSGIEYAVKFTGYLPNNQLPEYLAASDIYVSTSLSDGMPVSNLEAMACGVFPIMSDIPAAKQLITHGLNGFIVPAEQPKKLADNIIKAINDRGLRGRAAHHNAAFIRENFDAEVIFGKLEGEYKRLADSIF